VSCEDREEELQASLQWFDDHHHQYPTLSHLQVLRLHPQLMERFLEALRALASCRRPHDSDTADRLETKANYMEREFVRLMSQ
jgi:hypothetical protein